MEDSKAPVRRRALLARVRRKLESDKKYLKGCSPRSQAHSELGAFYILDSRQKIVKKDVELAALAEELAVLQPYETLVD